MNEQGITRSEIVNKLNLSVHGKLEDYSSIIGSAAKQDPEFLAHLIAFDATNGQVKDTKIALPIITLASNDFPDELVENSLAHLALLSPREMHKALKFSIAFGTPSRRQKKLQTTIRSYLKAKEANVGKWHRVVARHRRSMKGLYALGRAPMPEWASAILFGFKKNEKGEKIALSVPEGSIFADIKKLSSMSPTNLAAAIEKWHLSPLVISGALAGSKANVLSGVRTLDSVEVVQASMNQMSPTELITRTKTLERQGVSKNASLKESFRKNVTRATKSPKATLKTSVAAEEVEDDGLKTMLREVQERQIQSQKDAGRGVDGNVLLIVDKSGSQSHSIELGSHIAAAIAKFVTGKVWLVFCDTEVTPVDVTGLSLDQIKSKTKFIVANGGTSYGVGLLWAIEKQLEFDLVAIVGDGGENRYPFASVYGNLERLGKTMGRKPPVYFYQTFCAPGNPDPRIFESLMAQSNFPVTKFDLTSGKVDYYSIPNLVQTMNVSRFGLVEKIMACPLLTLDQVFKLVA